MLGDTNVLAVLVSGIAAMVIGAFWYSPLLFGTTWMKLVGLSKADLEKAKEKGMAKSYAMNFVATLATALVMSHFVTLSGATTLVMGAQLGAFLWLGFVATVMLGGMLWEGRPMQLYAINAVHYLVSFAVMGAILAIW